MTKSKLPTNWNHVRSILLVCRGELARCYPDKLLVESWVRAFLKKKGVVFDGIVWVNDLCGWSVYPEPVVDFANIQKCLIVGCRQRWLRGLLEAWRFCPKGVEMEIIGIWEEMEQQELLKDEEHREEEGGEWVQREIEWSFRDHAWFPVIDNCRCTHCKLCLSYCLFGVYREDQNGKVTVYDPFACKDRCPACAYLCPEGAIMFGKHRESPWNGEEIHDEFLFRERQSLYREMGLDKILRQNIEREGIIIDEKMWMRNVNQLATSTETETGQEE